jgi:saccharopine dehydrogenase-like NADP-dependent oxidoreductase
MIRCGLLGYGAWGTHHARVIAANPHARLVAIAARSAASQNRARQDHPASAIVTDYRALLERNDLDAVVVVLPSHLHFEVAKVVLQSGRQAYRLSLAAPNIGFEIVTVVGESSRRRWDLSKAEKLLGYRPTIRLEDLGYQLGDDREPF